MSELPTGTVTFLFTDIEGSTPLWERSPQAMRNALDRHHTILQTAIEQHGGKVFQIVGDAFCVAFDVPIQAVETALAAQRALAKEPWGETGPLRVRMGIHTGPAEVEQGTYLSNYTLNRVAHLMSAGHGGQILISAAVAALVREHLAEDVDLEDLGEHRLKGLSQPEHVYQVAVPDLQSRFPALLTQMESMSSDELLSTKLATPHLRAPLVMREPLLAKLDKGLDHKLTLISAPAGFGKTTLVAEWIADLRLRANDVRTKFAWVSLDSGDNDPVRFWRYVLTASQAFENGISKAAIDILNHSPEPPFEAILTLFINQAALLPGKAILILDDYHVITAQQIHETLAFFLEHLPPALHIVLLTRSDPPLPLGRMRARNELDELRAEDLRFSLYETRAFIEQTISVTLPFETVIRLAQRTEGWVAGLHLVALALQRRANQVEIQQFLETFTGSLRPIQEYLVEEVFAAQPEYLQEFLLRTSILSRLTGSLCDAVTGRNDSSILLERLERANLFLLPLDGVGQWYRFHALFSEALQHYARQRIGEAHLNELRHKASLWYEAHGMLPEAVEAALAALDTPRAAALIQRIIEPRMALNEYHTLRRWMEQIPEEVLRNYPTICMTYAVAILFTSDRHAPTTQARLQIPLQIAERHWQSEGDDNKLGEVLAFRSLVAWLQRDLRGSFSLARQALELLPEGEVQWRGISLVLAGAEELYAGRMNSARRTLTEARTFLETAENIFGVLDSTLLLGEVCYQQGELRQAAHTYRQVFPRLENAPMDRDQTLIRKGRALLGLGTLALEGNDLKAAEQYVAEGVPISQQFPEEDLLAHGPLVLARIKHARGETKQAMEILAELAAQTKFPVLLRDVRLNQARLSLARGDLSSVQRWSETRPQQADDILVFYQEQEALVVARLRIAQRQADEALRLLEGWLADAQAKGRVRSEMEIKILIALAQAALDHPPHAKQALIQALALAQSEGYRRLFLDEGEPMRLLIEECRSEVTNPGQEYLRDYMDQLLIAFPEKVHSPGDRGQLINQRSSINNLIEPLSEQEQRVLRLIGAGLSNPEIAQELVISLNTVKTHVKSIYRKLNVSSRREARQIARHLDLI